MIEMTEGTIITLIICITIIILFLLAGFFDR